MRIRGVHRVLGLLECDITDEHQSVVARDDRPGFRQCHRGGLGTPPSDAVIADPADSPVTGMAVRVRE